jgi:cytochrome c biogenesis protein CcdA
VLSLLSPCSALLLPAFLAYAVSSRVHLVRRTLVFLAGQCTLLVPLGLGASLVGALLIDDREQTIVVAGVLLVGLGLAELLSLPLTASPPRFLQRGTVYSTGLVYGMAGFCAGPLLGGVLTLAAADPRPLVGASLLVTYALGTTAPLFVLALAWDHYDLGRRGWLRGRPVRLGRLRVHSTNVLAGLLLIALGASFIASQGSSALSGVYDDLGLSDLGFRVQEWLADSLNGP